MREEASTRHEYPQDRDGYLWIAVERITNMNGKRTTRLSVERYVDCKDEAVGPNTSLSGCTLDWESAEAISNSDLHMDTNLRGASLDTTLRGQRLTAEWRAQDECTPGGSTIKMGFRSAVATSRWGDDVSPWQKKATSAFFRNAEPSSAHRPGNCLAP